MAPTFRYRYVDFTTVFLGDPRQRGAEQGVESPGTLFANELATDVGRTCWSVNEPLAVIDHHFFRDCQFPSSSAAVLHKARAIGERFGRHDGVVWLVTHKHPDFDALCSLYLARWIIEHPGPPLDWERYGLNPDIWFDLPHQPRIDWFNPNLTDVPVEHRWLLLLASYASIVDNAHPLPCPRQRALHSILHAALKRGRDYLSEASGATEFFDEVQRTLRDRQLNPAFDSVLEDSAQFAPELAMLEREAEAYQRDLLRARKSIVYLPESEAPSPNFFKSPKEVARLQQQGKSSDIQPELLLLADTFRIPTNAIYLRDPECLLFTEWARLDAENSSLGRGFEFTAIACSNGRPAGTINKTHYCFSIDPERANGRHLYTVSSRLQTKEAEALRAQTLHPVPGPGQQAAEQSHAMLGKLFADPWFDGQNYFGTIVATPKKGTLIGPAGIRSDLRDDPVADAVRTELEDAVYSAESLVDGPRVTVVDFSGAKDRTDIAALQFDLNTPLEIPAPASNYFRFGSVGLRADVPLTPGTGSGHGLSRQIGETLWQVLYPDMPGATPANFVEQHLVVTLDSVGVWGDRGIVVALKHPAAAEASAVTEDRETAARRDFARVISLARDVDRLVEEGEWLSRAAASEPDATYSAEQNAALEKLVATGEELSRRAAQVKHSLTLPNRDLLRCFCDAIGIDDLLTTLRDVNQNAAERLRRNKLAEQSQRMEESAKVVAEVQGKLRWLEVFVLTFLGIEIIEMITRHFRLQNKLEDALVLLGGPIFLVFTGWMLKPWKRKSSDKPGALDRPAWILVVLVLACIAGWLAGLLRLWGK